jgi:hypothetical protein
MVQGEDDITVYREQLPPRGDKLRSFCSMERLATAVAINPRMKRPHCLKGDSVAPFART